MGNTFSSVVATAGTSLNGLVLPTNGANLKRLIKYWVNMWLWFAGLENDKLRLRRMYRDWRNRSNTKNGFALLILNMYYSLYKAVRLILVPEVFGRYIVANCTLHLFYEVFSRVYRIMLQWSSTLTARGRKLRKLKKQLASANSFAERQAIGNVLDQLEGNDKWRQEVESPYFDYTRVQKKIEMYKRLQLESDYRGLMFYLRQGLLRKHWGLANPRLYSKSYVGTKHIVEDYMETVAQSMNVILNAEPDEEMKEELSLENKLTFFNETRHAFGRSALLLSGGGASGMYHAGVVQALVEQDLLPTVISGSSAGSIVAGIVGVRTDQEIHEAVSSDAFCFKFFGTNIDLVDMENWKPSFLKKLPRKMQKLSFVELIQEVGYLVHRLSVKHYVLDIQVLGECLRQNIGDYTFREAYDRTGKIINVTISPTESSDYPQLLNYLTAPNVLIWSACLASSAIPWIFSSVELLSKDSQGRIVPYCPEGLKWSDGSVECDLPMERLSEMFNVNHFIVSQVNIHYRLISGYSSFGDGKVNDLMGFLKKQMKAYIKHIVELGLDTTVLKLLGVGIVPFFTQKYEGDITIVANEEVSLPQLFKKVLSNPTIPEFHEMTLVARRATFRHISQIRTMCRIEFALEKAVRRLRAELAFQDAKGGKSLRGVPSFYTSNSHHNFEKLMNHVQQQKSTGLSSHEKIKRTKSINVGGAVMTMESVANISESQSWTT